MCWVCVLWRCLYASLGACIKELLPPAPPPMLLLQINPRTYIGSGKVAEILDAVAATGATTVIFDDELSPGGR